MLHETLKMADLVCLFTYYEIYGGIHSVTHQFMIHVLHYLISVFLLGSLWTGIMFISLLTLAEVLKCMNDQAQHVITT